MHGWFRYSRRERIVIRILVIINAREFLKCAPERDESNHRLIPANLRTYHKEHGIRIHSNKMLFCMLYRDQLTTNNLVILYLYAKDSGRLLLLVPLDAYRQFCHLHIVEYNNFYIQNTCLFPKYASTSSLNPCEFTDLFDRVRFVLR